MKTPEITVMDMGTVTDMGTATDMGTVTDINMVQQSTKNDRSGKRFGIL